MTIQPNRPHYSILVNFLFDADSVKRQTHNLQLPHLTATSLVKSSE